MHLFTDSAEMSDGTIVITTFWLPACPHAATATGLPYFPFRLLSRLLAVKMVQLCLQPVQEGAVSSDCFVSVRPSGPVLTNTPEMELTTPGVSSRSCSYRNSCRV